jgi:hypothetical protein
MVLPFVLLHEIFFVYKKHMAKNQIQTLIDTISENPEFVSNLLNGVNGAKNIIGSSLLDSPTPSGPQIRPSIVTQLPAFGGNITQREPDMSDYSLVIYVIIGLLIVWSVAVIVGRYTIKDTTEKENFLYIHDVLFGTTGMVPIIIAIIFVYFILVSIGPLIPSITTFFNKNSNIGSGILDTIKSSVGLLVGGK